MLSLEICLSILLLTFLCIKKGIEAFILNNCSKNSNEAFMVVAFDTH